MGSVLGCDVENKKIAKNDNSLTQLLEKYDLSVKFPFDDATNVCEYLITYT